MAVPKVQVRGKVVLPSSDGATGGRIVLELSHVGSVMDSGVVQVVEGRTVAAIGLDGAVGFYLVPNELISPGVTFYRVAYELPDGQVFREFWQLDSIPSPIDIGQVRRVDGIYVAPLVQVVTAYPEVMVLPDPTLTPEGSVCWIKGGAGQQSIQYALLKPYDGDEFKQWVPTALGGSKL